MVGERHWAVEHEARGASPAAHLTLCTDLEELSRPCSRHGGGRHRAVDYRTRGHGRRQQDGLEHDDIAHRVPSCLSSCFDVKLQSAWWRARPGYPPRNTRAWPAARCCRLVSARRPRRRSGRPATRATPTTRTTRRASERDEIGLPTRTERRAFEGRAGRDRCRVCAHSTLGRVAALMAARRRSMGGSTKFGRKLNRVRAPLSLDKLEDQGLEAALQMSCHRDEGDDGLFMQKRSMHIHRRLKNHRNVTAENVCRHAGVFQICAPHCSQIPLLCLVRGRIFTPVYSLRWRWLKQRMSIADCTAYRHLIFACGGQSHCKLGDIGDNVDGGGPGCQSAATRL